MWVRKNDTFEVNMQLYHILFKSQNSSFDMNTCQIQIVTSLFCINAERANTTNLEEHFASHDCNCQIAVLRLPLIPTTPRLTSITPSARQVQGAAVSPLQTTPSRGRLGAVGSSRVQCRARLAEQTRDWSSCYDSSMSSYSYIVPHEYNF